MPNFCAVILAALLMVYPEITARTINSNEPILRPESRSMYAPTTYRVPGMDKYLKQYGAKAVAGQAPVYIPVAAAFNGRRHSASAISASDAASTAEPAWSRFAFWQAQPGKNSRVCRLSLENYDRDVRDTVALIDALHKDGLTAAERSFRNDCFSSLQLPPAMAAYDATVRSELRDNPEVHAVMRAYFNDWLPRRNWITERVATEQFIKRADGAQKLANLIRKAYKLPAINVHLINLPRGIPLLGHYVPSYNDGKPAIIINGAEWANLLDKPEKLLPVLLEETRHSIDHAAMKRLRNQTLQPSDPQYFHAALIAMNLQPAGYARSNDGNAKDEADGDRKELDVLYRSQYVERTAKTFANKVSDELLALK